jgi:cell wall-active antibiotic response 4TMS protein YvqF
MRNRYRSLFWPAVLIVIGVIALLVNAGVISTDRLYLLFDLWPLILIVIGLEIFARRAFQGAAAELAAVLIVLVAAAGAVAYVAVAPGVSLGIHTLDTSGSMGSVEQASVEVDAGAANITMAGSSGLGSDLYRAHIEYSGLKPDVTFDRSSGRLRLSQQNGNYPFFESHTFVLDLRLNPGVPWAIINNTAALNSTFSLANVQLRSMQFNTAASHDDITLGTPSGIVPITVNAAALTVNIHRPGGTATSVTVSGAAVNLDADGRQTHAFGSANWESSNFSGATDGYRIEIDGAACNVTVDATEASS